VWRSCWPAFEVFLRCQTQWRVSMSGFIGLDYVAVIGVLNLYKIENKQQVLEDLQIIETTVVKLMNKEAQ